MFREADHSGCEIAALFSCPHFDAWLENTWGPSAWNAALEKPMLPEQSSLYAGLALTMKRERRSTRAEVPNRDQLLRDGFLNYVQSKSKKRGRKRFIVSVNPAV